MYAGQNDARERNFSRLHIMRYTSHDILPYHSPYLTSTFQNHSLLNVHHSEQSRRPWENDSRIELQRAQSEHAGQERPACRDPTEPGIYRVSKSTAVRRK